MGRKHRQEGRHGQAEPEEAGWSSCRGAERIRRGTGEVSVQAGATSPLVFLRAELGTGLGSPGFRERVSSRIQVKSLYRTERGQHIG